MANWCNVRLIITGQHADVLSFSRLSSTRPSSLFAPDMLQGEAQDLMSDRMRKVDRGLAKKVYRFQVRNDDGRAHFCQLSLQFPRLNFVLVYGDVYDSFGSYFISDGQVQDYELPDQIKEEVMARHGVTEDSDDDVGFWEASWELMDLAEAHWHDVDLDADRQ